MPSGPAPDPKSGSAGGNEERGCVRGTFTWGTHSLPWEVAGYPGILEMELKEIQVSKGWLVPAHNLLAPSPLRVLGCLMSDLINWDG